MTISTPLLTLLDGVLSQDEVKTRQAMTRIKESDVLVPVEDSLLVLSSGLALERVVTSLLIHKPEWAFVPSKHDGSLPLHFAASIGNIPLLRLILSSNPKAAVAPNQKGKIPLHYAAREGRTEIVEFFMSAVPETAAIRSKKDKLALHFAAGEGHVGVVRALLKAHPRGASLQSKKGKVAIHFAARWGHLQIASDLLAVAPETISVVDYEGSSALHDAAREGQTEMMKFLVQRFPEGLKNENLRGETPLFPAVRSGNLELVKFMIRAWPRGGRHVLQGVREDDNVAGWDPGMLEICLRGAVDILASEEVSSKPTSGDDQATEDEEEKDTSADANSIKLPLNSEDNGTYVDGNSTPRSQELEINLPRSKSPILDDSQPSSKKRPHADGEGSSRKRTCLGSADLLSEWRETSELRTFHEVHAALECGASAPVLNFVLDRHGGSQLDTIDELGRMPLHVALESSSVNKAQLMDIVLERIWKPYQEACSHRDFLGRLPLHYALKNCVDSKLVKALLESNPYSGVEFCDVLDPMFTDKLPLEMAIACGCELSTIYMLLRGDPSLVATWPADLLL